MGRQTDVPPHVQCYCVICILYLTQGGIHQDNDPSFIGSLDFNAGFLELKYHPQLYGFHGKRVHQTNFDPFFGRSTLFLVVKLHNSFLIHSNSYYSLSMTHSAQITFTPK